MALRWFHLYWSNDKGVLFINFEMQASVYFSFEDDYHATFSLQNKTLHFFICWLVLKQLLSPVPVPSDTVRLSAQ